MAEPRGQWSIKGHGLTAELRLRVAKAADLSGMKVGDWIAWALEDRAQAAIKARGSSNPSSDPTGDAAKLPLRLEDVVDLLGSRIAEQIGTVREEVTARLDRLESSNPPGDPNAEAERIAAEQARIARLERATRRLARRR